MLVAGKEKVFATVSKGGRGNWGLFSSLTPWENGVSQKSLLRFRGEKRKKKKGENLAQTHSSPLKVPLIKTRIFSTHP